MYRILIIDDEKAIRDVIRDILTACVPEAEIIGEADGVASGIEAINRHYPDIVLLDIRLADGNGFDILNGPAQHPFKVIFITAYDEYAIRAFKYSAVDYILKPIDPEELATAITKAGQVIQQELEQRLAVLRENLNETSRCKKILLKTAENIYLVKTDDIFLLESDQSYTRFYLPEEKHIVVSRSLREFEEMLQASGFFRVHKSFLINIHKIDHFEKADGGFVVMRNGFKVPVASRKREQFLQQIENLT